MAQFQAIPPILKAQIFENKSQVISFPISQNMASSEIYKHGLNFSTVQVKSIFFSCSSNNTLKATPSFQI